MSYEAVFKDAEEHIDPLPLAEKLLLNGGNASTEEVMFLCRSLVRAHKKVDSLYESLENGSGIKLLCVAKKFVVDNEVRCEESVYQMDSIQENALEFTAECCKLVGFYED